MKRMIIIEFALTALLLCAASASLCAADSTAVASAGDKARKENIMDRKVYHMGEQYGVDSSKVSHRSFPKRLVVPKGAMSAGLQVMWLKMDAADAQALALVTGVNGAVSFLNVAPAFAWAYANNNALGLRFGYNNVAINVESGTVRLMSDDLKFDLGGINTNMHTYAAAIFNRSWFGLDRRGRLSLFVDVAAQYSYSHSFGEDTKAETHKVSLNFAPGFEAFVMNNLSIFFSLNFAKLSYSTSTCYNWIQSNDEGSETDTSGSGKWEAQGTSEGFKAQARLSLLDLNFGLTFFF